MSKRASLGVENKSEFSLKYCGVCPGGWPVGSLPHVPATRAHPSIYNPPGQEASDIGGGLRIWDFSLPEKSLLEKNRVEKDLSDEILELGMEIKKAMKEMEQKEPDFLSEVA
ncbi:hypothetical protein Fot_40183 [Forsythia ovata]|uniref:Uncharacterized protein n=1 Tax=Forsythia ovata TaxID=205694 RepID=A0ABD1S7I4_9LAMI